MDSPHPERATPRAPLGEAGFIALEWALAIVTLLIPMVLVGAGVSRWPEHQQAARAAAAEAARAAVIAPTAEEADGVARAVAAQVATNYGLDPSAVTVAFAAPTWDWGAEITVTVTVEMPTLDVPGVGSWSATDWSTSSTQRIEDYRGFG